MTAMSYISGKKKKELPRIRAVIPELMKQAEKNVARPCDVVQINIGFKA